MTFSSAIDDSLFAGNRLWMNFIVSMIHISLDYFFYPVFMKAFKLR